jgi:hypothetical protein
MAQWWWAAALGKEEEGVTPIRQLSSRRLRFVVVVGKVAARESLATAKGAKEKEVGKSSQHLHRAHGELHELPFYCTAAE